MIVCSPVELPIGKAIDRFYEGPQTNGNLVPCRIMALRVATEQEYLDYGQESYPNDFHRECHKERGWNYFYEISMD